MASSTTRARTWLLRLLVAAAAAAVVLAGVGWWRGGVGPLVGGERCVAVAASGRVQLAPAQAQHAATIATVAVQRHLPRRAVQVALATAMQESDLRNLRNGDRDSAGLFQQRPSQGWGTFDEVTSPRVAAERFYDALLRVPGWQQMPVTRAAQAVQRSSFPDAYQQHAASARILATALTGKTAAFSCTLRPSASPQPVRDETRTLRQTLQTELGRLAGHLHVRAAKDGPRVVVHAVHGPGSRRGWTLAAWLVANADRLHVQSVRAGDLVWTAARSPQAWQPA